LRDSIDTILSIIRHEASIVSPDHIILAGISQGCGTAIHALLHGGTQLGGIIGLCSWLPFQDDVEQAARSSSPNSLQEIRDLLVKAPANESKDSSNINLAIK
jgi:predicted esterase